MKKRISALIVVLMLVVPSGAYALETNELIAIAAMPLAVAAVADIAEVPTGELMSVVSAMNRASVPAPQFVEVVRYVPVALVDRSEPTFVSYVTTQVDNGLVGDALAVSLADRMVTTYGVSEINVVNPQTVYVVERREFVPTIVTTRLQPVDPLSLVAMPLAVAAVANLTDVPANDLISFISALNRAAVPAPQFIEVVRYSPVVFIDDTMPQFLSFVTTEVDRGIRGDALAVVIADRFRTIGVREINVVNPPQTVFVGRTEFFPPVVRTRLAERRAHPHGGPPGQLKKVAGVQTGAEIIHGTQPRQRVVVRRDDDMGKARKSDRVTRQEARRQDEQRVAPPQRGRSEGKKNKAVSASADRGNSRDKAKGNSNGKGKGKGKG